MSRLLWIDDEITADDPIVRFLAREGYFVHLANTGAEALEHVHITGYDVLFLDLRLPDIGGVELLDRLRQNGVWSPTIVLTGFATVEAAAATMRLGAVNLLQKPVELDDVGEALRLALYERDLPRRHLRPVSRHLRNIDEAVKECGANHDATVAARLRVCVLKALVHALIDASVPRLAAISFASAVRKLLMEAAADNVSNALYALREWCGREPRRRDLAVERILSALAAQPMAISERELASSIGMSSRTMRTIIRCETGSGFREWRTLLRTLRALTVLLHSEEQIAQIAFTAGYEHPSQLDRDFRRVFGVTPRRFRALLSQENVSYSQSPRAAPLSPD